MFTTCMRFELYNHKNRWKLVLLVVAVLIAIGTLWYTETFIKQQRAEETKRVEIWAEATKLLATVENGAQLDLALKVIQLNTTIPVILTDSDTNIIQYRNFNIPRSVDERAYIEKQLQEMIDDNQSIVHDISPTDVNILFYKNSRTLTQLRIYPMVLLCVIGLFIMIAYMAFSNVRRSEQNRVWTGMAKETAHQIGTPLSSLMGWIEILRSQNASEDALMEMEKDIHRLQTITDRFSKIGSIPKLEPVDIVQETESSMSYMDRRSSKRITLQFHNEIKHPVIIPLSSQLFGWVIENLVRNAIDAIEGKGQIDVTLSETSSNVQLEFKDTGKGMAPGIAKAIFRPGYTTKSRGWGLGLSLAKRIIEEFHGGKIVVLKTAPGKGTTFRITLPKK